MPVNLERALRADGRLGDISFKATLITSRPLSPSIRKAQTSDSNLNCPKTPGIMWFPRVRSLLMALVLPLRKYSRSFVVWIIPYTKRHTNLDRASTGDRVNLEFDILAKYVERMIAADAHQRMTARRSIKRRPRVVGVIASRADLAQAIRMRKPPDLFELRLDCLVDFVDQVKRALPNLSAPILITARDPHEGGARKLRLPQRRDLLEQFLNHAAYMDIELRSARALRSLFELAGKKRVRRIISFHNFKCTPSVRILAAKAREARSHGADIFKVATRTDTPMELGRLLEFITTTPLDLALAVMGIGKLGAISRVLLARAGSVLATLRSVRGLISKDNCRWNNSAPWGSAREIGEPLRSPSTLAVCSTRIR